MPIAYSYIRFSTVEQGKGHSEQRQDEAAKRYCKEHGLILDQTLSLRDLGVSGYRGKNAQTGALSCFLGAVARRRVAPGSLLLVENFDRLSRNQIGKSIELLLSIINGGIEVVTLHDGARYNLETINASVIPLMTSLLSFDRAHQESYHKGTRVNEAWKAKRARAKTEKLTARAPLWLTLSSDRKEFRPIPERVAVVKEIYSMAVAGYGKRAIVSHLNRAGVTPWAKAKRLKPDEPPPVRHGWHESYVLKIIHNRAVIGEYQPHERKGDKRFPVGAPITDYYPAIIDEETFAKLNSPRFKLNGGRSEAQVTNLFTHLVFCGFTDLPMRYIDKGTKKRGGGKWRYLYNAGAQHGLPNSSIHYATFEKAFLFFVRHLDWSAIATEVRPSTKLADLDAQITQAEMQLAETRTKTKRLIELVTGTGSAPKTIIATLHELESAEETLVKSIQELKNARVTEDVGNKAIQEEDTILRDLAAGEADYETRLRLQQELRSKIKRITIWGRFSGPSPIDATAGKTIKTRIRSNPNPSFEVAFANGVTRHVNLPSFKTSQASFTLETVGEQIIGKNHPIEERSPKPFSNLSKITERSSSLLSYQPKQLTMLKE